MNNGKKELQRTIQEGIKVITRNTKQVKKLENKESTNIR